MKKLLILIAGLTSGGLYLASVSAQRPDELITELRQRMDSEGLTLADFNNQRLVLVRFGEQLPVYIPFPVDTRFIVDCLFAPTGRAIALKEYDEHGRVRIYQMDGRFVAATRGYVRNTSAWALTADLKSLSLCGTYVTRGENGFSEQRYEHGVLTVEVMSERIVRIRPFENPDEDRYRCGQMSWSGSGSRLAYEYDGSTFVWDADRNVSWLLVKGTLPSWSPDGEWIAFRNSDGNLQLISPDGALGNVLYNGGNVGGGVKWSPDGRYIAFGIHEYVPPFETSRLMVVRIRDGRMVKVKGVGDLGNCCRHWWAYFDFGKTPWKYPEEWEERWREERERQQRKGPRE